MSFSKSKSTSSGSPSQPFNDWPNDAGFDATAEQRKPVELVVHGIIPPALSGVLYRTGPSQYKISKAGRKDYKVSHLFDGFSHIHRFQFIPSLDESCKVMYNSRRQVDALVDHVHQIGKFDAISFGQKRDPGMSFLQKMKASLEPVSGIPVLGENKPEWANVGITIQANVPGYSKSNTSPPETSPIGNIITFTDSNVAKQIDPNTLEPTGLNLQQHCHPQLAGPLSCAHAQVDPVNGDIYNYNLEFGATPTYRIFRTLQSTSDTEILATLSGSGISAACIHSFFMTSDFIILCLWPSFFAAAGAKILWERNIIDSLAKFDPRAETRWLVVDRKHSRGLVATFTSPAIFSYHTINAWQEPGSDDKLDIICDLVQYPNLDNVHALYYDVLMSTGPKASLKSYTGKNDTTRPTFARYRLAGVPNPGTQPAAAPSRSTQIPKADQVFTLPSPLIGEPPTINPAYRTRESRYVYSVVDRGLSSFSDGLVKTDLETRTAVYWEQAKHTPGEAIFVADPERRGVEDGGWLLSVVLDGEKGVSYLLVLDAGDLREVGRADVGVAVGFGFHGMHVGL